MPLEPSGKPANRETSGSRGDEHTVWDAKFRDCMTKLTMVEREQSTDGVFDIPWDAIPSGPTNLGIHQIGNPDDPGDGGIYSFESLVFVTNFLNDYFQAWTEACFKSHPVGWLELSKPM